VLKFFLPFLFLLATSCAVRSVYVPSTQNVSLPDTLPEIKAAAYLGLNTFIAQMNHNPTSRFMYGLQLHYGAGLSTYEGQVGTYVRFKRNPAWRAEIASGAGYTNNYYLSDVTPIELVQKKNSSFETIGRYTKGFIQPAIGYFGRVSIYSLNYSFAFSTRINWLYFYDFVYREVDEDESKALNETVYVIDRVYYDSHIFTLEPCITNKVWRKNLCGVIQLLGIIPYSKDVDLRYVPFSPGFLLSVGLQYNLPLRKRK
jgi:hypothetical protein